MRNGYRALNNQESACGVEKPTLHSLERMIDVVNPYVKVFHNAHDIFEVVNVINLSIRIIKAHVGRQYTLSTVDEVATLIVGGNQGVDERRDIIVRKIRENLQ